METASMVGACLRDILRLICTKSVVISLRVWGILLLVQRWNNGVIENGRDATDSSHHYTHTDGQHVRCYEELSYKLFLDK